MKINWHVRGNQARWWRLQPLGDEWLLISTVRETPWFDRWRMPGDNDRHFTAIQQAEEATKHKEEPALARGRNVVSVDERFSKDELNVRFLKLCIVHSTTADRANRRE